MDPRAAVWTEERLHRAIRSINASGGLQLANLRRLAGGAQGGAWLATYARKEWVVKFGVPVDGLDERMELVARARLRGWPTPAWLCCGSVDDGSGPVGYYVQTRVHARSPRACTDGVLNQILRTNDLQRDLCSGPLPGRSHRALLAQRLEREAAAIRSRNPSLAQFVELAEQAAVQALSRVDDRWPEHDFVHNDFSLTNFLFRRGRLAGVVDCGECEVGSRAVDVADLVRQSACYQWNDGLRTHLMTHLMSNFDPGPVLLSTAYVVSKNVAWCLSHRPDVVLPRSRLFCDLLADVSKEFGGGC